MTRLAKSTEKKKISNIKSYKPRKVEAETRGNKNTSSISYKRKNIHISKNCIGTRIGFCEVGRNPHS